MNASDVMDECQTTLTARAGVWGAEAADCVLDLCPVRQSMPLRLLPTRKDI